VLESPLFCRGSKLFINFSDTIIALMVHIKEVRRANNFVARMDIFGYHFSCATLTQIGRDWLCATRVLSFQAQHHNRQEAHQGE